MGRGGLVDHLDHVRQMLPSLLLALYHLLDLTILEGRLAQLALLTSSIVRDQIEVPE